MEKLTVHGDTGLGSYFLLLCFECYVPRGSQVSGRSGCADAMLRRCEIVFYKKMGCGGCLLAAASRLFCYATIKKK